MRSKDMRMRCILMEQRTFGHLILCMSQPPQDAAHGIIFTYSQLPLLRRHILDLEHTHRHAHSTRPLIDTITRALMDMRTRTQRKSTNQLTQTRWH